MPVTVQWCRTLQCLAWRLTIGSLVIFAIPFSASSQEQRCLRGIANPFTLRGRAECFVFQVSPRVFGLVASEMGSVARCAISVGGSNELAVLPPCRLLRPPGPHFALFDRSQRVAICGRLTTGQAGAAIWRQGRWQTQRVKELETHNRLAAAGFCRHGTLAALTSAELLMRTTSAKPNWDKIALAWLGPQGVSVFMVPDSVAGSVALGLDGTLLSVVAKREMRPGFQIKILRCEFRDRDTSPKVTLLRNVVYSRPLDIKAIACISDELFVLAGTVASQSDRGQVELHARSRNGDWDIRTVGLKQPVRTIVRVTCSPGGDSVAVLYEMKDYDYTLERFDVRSGGFRRMEAFRLGRSGGVSFDFFTLAWRNENTPIVAWEEWWPTD